MRDAKPTAAEIYVESLYMRAEGESGGGSLVDARLCHLEERLRRDGKWGVNLGPNEARLLALLVRLSRAKRIVEIGTQYGYSAVALARALPEGGHLWTLERDAAHADQARITFAEFELESKITLLEGDAKELLPTLNVGGPYDFVFIDANKSAYVDYLDWCERHVRPGGMLVADNVFLGGQVFDEAPAKPSTMWRKMREFNRRLSASDGRFESVILPTSEGLTCAVRK